MSWVDFKATFYGLIGILVLVGHGGMFYNTVAFQNIVRADPSFTDKIAHAPSLLNNGTAHYLIGDIIGGSLLNPIMDIVGPRKFALMGHVTNITSYAILAFAPRSMAHAWLPAVMMLFGMSLQMTINPTMLLGNKFGVERASLMVILLGASCEFSLTTATFWLWSGISVANGCKILIGFSVCTGVFVLTCYGDSYADFEREKDEFSVSSGINSPASVLSELALTNGYFAGSPHGLLTPRPGSVASSFGAIDSTPIQGPDDMDISLREILASSRFLRTVIPYFLLFFVFQIQTTYWTDSMAHRPLLNTCFYIGSFISVIFGMSTGFIAFRFSSMMVSKYYYLAAAVVCGALASNTVLAMAPGIFLYFTYKSCIFTIWFAVVNESFMCKNLGTMFAVPQFFGSALFWMFNLRFGETMTTPNKHSKLIWTILSICMVLGFILSTGVRHGKPHRSVVLLDLEHRLIK